jgi:hypothetical protein
VELIKIYSRVFFKCRQGFEPGTVITQARLLVYHGKCSHMVCSYNCNKASYPRSKVLCVAITPCVGFVLVGDAVNMEQIWYMMILYTHMILIVFQQDT